MQNYRSKRLLRNIEMNKLNTDEDGWVTCVFKNLELKDVEQEWFKLLIKY